MDSKSLKCRHGLRRPVLVLLLAFGALSFAQAQSRGGGPGYGGHGGHGGPGGAYAGGWHAQAGYRYGHPGYGRYYRPYYGGWYGGYWGPRIGVYWGPGYWGGWPYAPAYGAYAWGYPYGFGSTTVVIGSTTPQTFVQQEAAPPATKSPPAPTGYWYYCRQPAGYFPYVKDCSQDWLKVVPQAPGEQPTAPRLAQ